MVAVGDAVELVGERNPEIDEIFGAGAAGPAIVTAPSSVPVPPTVTNVGAKLPATSVPKSDRGGTGTNLPAVRAAAINLQ